MQDIHTHLYWQSYDADRDAVVRRAREAGVKEMFVIGCTVDESKQAIALARQYSDMYAAIGIHPHFFNELVEKNGPVSQEEIQELVLELGELARHEKVVAVGECGLDYYSHDEQKIISSQQKIIQKAGFLEQVELAYGSRLPVIVHCRPSRGTQDAYEDMFEIFRDSYSVRPDSYFILHCYMGDTEVTRKFLTLPHIYFSFAGNSTYPVKSIVSGTKDDFHETVRLVPLERIFAETDCPFLAPQSKRGERNEPSNVREILDCIAKLHGKERSAVARSAEENLRKVFPKTT